MLLGPLILDVNLVIAIPVTVMGSGAAAAGILGWALRDNGEATHEGSELIELS
jgi:hypothetical protein